MFGKKDEMQTRGLEQNLRVVSTDASDTVAVLWNCSYFFFLTPQTLVAVLMWRFVSSALKTQKTLLLYFFKTRG